MPEGATGVIICEGVEVLAVPPVVPVAAGALFAEVVDPAVLVLLLWEDVLEAAVFCAVLILDGEELPDEDEEEAAGASSGLSGLLESSSGSTSSAGMEGLSPDPEKAEYMET